METAVNQQENLALQRKPKWASRVGPIGRAVALFFGGFTLLNLAGDRAQAGFDANIWWIDLGFLPQHTSVIFLATAALSLLIFSFGGDRNRMVRSSVQVMMALLLAAVLCNVATFYFQWHAGRIHPTMPVPLSMGLGLALVLVLVASISSRRARNWRDVVWMGSTAVVCGVIFPLSQMYCFGQTDYRRSADAIVVFGARTYADGTVSPALADRTLTAIQLYQSHLAPLLIFSGGPGDGAISEPQAMRRLAISKGVADSDILLDEQGLNTDMTVNNTVQIFQQRHLQRVLAVSHFYHLPRVKMTYSRALVARQMSVELLTVPAVENAPLPRMPFYMAREVAALWSYYLRPLLR